MRCRSLLLLPLVALALAACGSKGSGGLPPIGAAKPIGLTPPAGAVVDAVEWGSRDLAVARQGPRTTVQVVDGQGAPVSGLAVRVGGRAAAACGPGCYRGRAAAGPVIVAVGGRSWRFTIPARAPSGARLLAAAERAYARLHSVSLRQKLGSTPTLYSVADFTFVAPDRLRYTIRGGSQAIVVGARRWDRPTPHDAWVESEQQRVRVMHPPWRRAIDVHVVAPRTVTFYDPGTRAWFRVVLRAKSLPRTVLMTGVSHFMVDTFSGWDAPVRVTPPK